MKLCIFYCEEQQFLNHYAYAQMIDVRLRNLCQWGVLHNWLDQSIKFTLVCVMSNGFRLILDRKDISHNQELGVFTVLGTNGNPHAVRLFPSESCTCPSTSQCYHILAVRMSVGLIDQNGKKRINLTQLRRNKRTRKSGRKIPRVDDYDVIPAPDSMMSQNVCLHY